MRPRSDGAGASGSRRRRDAAPARRVAARGRVRLERRAARVGAADRASRSGRSPRRGSGRSRDPVRRGVLDAVRPSRGCGRRRPCSSSCASARRRRALAEPRRATVVASRAARACVQRARRSLGGRRPRRRREHGRLGRVGGATGCRRRGTARTSCARRDANAGGLAPRRRYMRIRHVRSRGRAAAAARRPHRRGHVEPELDAWPAPRHAVAVRRRRCTTGRRARRAGCRATQARVVEHLVFWSPMPTIGSAVAPADAASTQSGRTRRRRSIPAHRDIVYPSLGFLRLTWRQDHRRQGGGARACASRSRATSRRSWPTAGQRPGLATVLVGDDPASRDLRRRQAEGLAARSASTASTSASRADTSREELVALIERLNADPEVSGIIVQLPLPDHLDGTEMTGLVRADKDVDGLTPMSAGLLALGRPGLRPCTPAGVMVLLEEAGQRARGRRGRRHRPLEPLRQADGPAAARRPTRPSPSATRARATCRRSAGAPTCSSPPSAATEMVKADWVKPGATVIDVGMNRTRGRPVRRRRLRRGRAEVAGAITPVPGGVGPMTIAMLLRNTLQAARMQIAGTRPGVKLSRLRSGERLALVGAVALAVLLGLDWFFLSTPDARVGAHESGIRSLGWFAALLLLARDRSRRSRSRSSPSPSARPALPIVFGGPDVRASALLAHAHDRRAAHRPARPRRRRGQRGRRDRAAGAASACSPRSRSPCGGWRAMADERTDSAESLEQTEDVLRVRGDARAPRAAPAAGARTLRARDRPRAGPARRAPRAARARRRRGRADERRAVRHPRPHREDRRARPRGRAADVARRRGRRTRCAPTSRARRGRARTMLDAAPAVRDDGFEVPSPQA